MVSTVHVRRSKRISDQACMLMTICMSHYDGMFQLSKVSNVTVLPDMQLHVLLAGCLAFDITVLNTHSVSVDSHVHDASVAVCMYVCHNFRFFVVHCFFHSALETLIKLS